MKPQLSRKKPEFSMTSILIKGRRDKEKEVEPCDDGSRGWGNESACQGLPVRLGSRGEA